ncbi:hypothetical protein FRC01_005392 [Tulasnella sp. 417]|nr:hypothetical protein FRC01_005392 [Tulasnella sp. 417]
MPDIISEKVVLELYPDFPSEFLKYLSSDAVSSAGATLASVHYVKREYQNNYFKMTVAGVYELWKSLSETAENLELANTQLTARLARYADDRILSGLKMKHWQVTSAKLKSAQLAKIRGERRAIIFAKLTELGYLEADFPRYHFEVNNPVALADQEWERIRPIMVKVTESNRNMRIENQRLIRKNERSRALTNLWNDAVNIASGTRSVFLMEKGACYSLNDFVGQAPVAALLEADTDGIPAQDLDSIRPNALQFAIEQRRQYLVKLRNIRNGLPLEQFSGEEWLSLSNDETIAKLDTIAAELVQAVNGFWDSKRKTVDWYPSPVLGRSNVDFGVLSPAEGLAPGLISKLLETLGKDPSIEASAVTTGNWIRKAVRYRCARCDERVAPHLTFTELISHYLERKIWFDKASDAKAKALVESPGSNEPLSRSTLFNDHDWNTAEDIIASDNSHDKARITKRQNQLENAYGNDLEDYDREDVNTRSRRSAKKVIERRTRRICRLCPEGFSPQPMYFATLKIHIEHIHCKVADAEEDTAAFDPSQAVAPTEPWVFDVPYLCL